MKMEGWTGATGALALGATLAALWASAAGAVNVNIVSGATGNDIAVYKDLVKPWEAETGNTVTIVPMPSSTTDQFGQYKLWLAAGNADIDVYRTDVIWAPQLADQFLDLTEAAADVANDHFPSIIESQTVDGKLVALPFFTDAPALYYRKDLLEKYGAAVPKTWEEMAATAKKVMDGERDAGSADLWGFVFQGNAYEGLTCNALEWVKSNGGGQIIEPDGTISINNAKSVKALDMAKGWVGTISPPGVLSYRRRRAAASGRPATPSSCATGPMPTRSATAPTARSRASSTWRPCRRAAATTLGGDARRLERRGLASIPRTRRRRSSWRCTWRRPRVQKENALPPLAPAHHRRRSTTTRRSREKQPIIPRWKDIFLNAVPRPSAPTKTSYNEVSSRSSGPPCTTPCRATALPRTTSRSLEADLTSCRGGGW